MKKQVPQAVPAFPFPSFWWSAEDSPDIQIRRTTIKRSFQKCRLGSFHQPFICFFGPMVHGSIWHHLTQQIHLVHSVEITYFKYCNYIYIYCTGFNIAQIPAPTIELLYIFCSCLGCDCNRGELPFFGVCHEKMSTTYQNHIQRNFTSFNCGVCMDFHVLSWPWSTSDQKKAEWIVLYFPQSLWNSNTPTLNKWLGISNPSEHVYYISWLLLSHPENRSLYRELANKEDMSLINDLELLMGFPYLRIFTILLFFLRWFQQYGFSLWLLKWKLAPTWNLWVNGPTMPNPIFWPKSYRANNPTRQMFTSWIWILQIWFESEARQ